MVRHLLKNKRRVIHHHLQSSKLPKYLILLLIILFLVVSIISMVVRNRFQNLKKEIMLQQINPITTQAIAVLDGDTLITQGGWTMGLLGINLLSKNEENYMKAKELLENLVTDKTLTLEYYDVFQNDKFGRILAYVWVDCMSEYHNLCMGDKLLVNKVMISKELASKDLNNDRKLRYGDFLN